MHVRSGGVPGLIAESMILSGLILSGLIRSGLIVSGLGLLRSFGMYRHGAVRGRVSRACTMTFVTV
jgi:hypothetical protein